MFKVGRIFRNINFKCLLENDCIKYSQLLKLKNDHKFQKEAVIKNPDNFQYIKDTKYDYNTMLEHVIIDDDYFEKYFEDFYQKTNFDYLDKDQILLILSRINKIENINRFLNESITREKAYDNKYYFDSNYKIAMWGMHMLNLNFFNSKIRKDKQIIYRYLNENITEFIYINDELKNDYDIKKFLLIKYGEYALPYIGKEILHDEKLMLKVVKTDPSKFFLVPEEMRSYNFMKKIKEKDIDINFHLYI